jgi:hypothetical protein
MTARGSRHIIFTLIEQAILKYNLKYKVSHDLKEMLGVEVCPVSRYNCPLTLKFG